MAKNSRPDIQVLEDRVTRLKSQLHEFEEIRLYKTSKNRLSVVAAELRQCIQILDRITDVDTSKLKVPSRSISNASRSLEPISAEFNNDEGDLAASLFAEDSKSDKSLIQNQSSMPPKEIVGTYLAKINKAIQVEGQSTGIIQVNQFWQLLHCWYQTRYAPEFRSPNFRFVADHICKWIDYLMLAAGQALHIGKFSNFIADIDSWIQGLNSGSDEGWVLPYSVMKMKNTPPSTYTKEAVLLELMVKPFIYDWSFYPDQLHTIRDLMIQNTEFTLTDLTVTRILAESNSLLRTASFDAAKYQQEVM